MGFSVYDSLNDNNINAVQKINYIYNYLQEIGQEYKIVMKYYMTWNGCLLRPPFVVL